MFNNHYNWDMGVVTAYNPTHETICTANNSPMNEVDRDELSKACVELDLARTTIKNLSEAVVNFSHNCNVFAPQQEKEEHNPQSPIPQTNPQPNTTTLPPQWVKSANPMVIKP